MSQSVPEVSQQPILPGATIGMVGGGQLGRMFAMAASAMGYRVVVFCESEDAPAAQVAHGVVVGELDDQAAVQDFASQCDVITLEFENIPAETIARCGDFAPTYPAASVLATAQDRLLEKNTLRDAGLPVTPFSEVHDADSLQRASEVLGWPMIVKTARSGYDGKGQHRVESIDDAQRVPWQSFDSWIAEKCIDFECEVSVVVGRSVAGDYRCFPVFENSHHNHILDVSVIPASISEALVKQATDVARRATETLDVVGLLCVEFFVSGNAVLINEVAPRPHNSGHLSIEACPTSQFEQHVRAICNVPLGETESRTDAAAMANLMGDLWQDGTAPDWSKALSVPGVSLHLYGKSAAKPGRKMGHLTATGSDRDEVRQRVERARQNLQSGE
ncbi:MAG: 5-(carboxyamino)imidazole ribonucleotide synthase [Rubripirellula sp.]